MVFVLCMGYAIIRYHVFGGVDWIHLPLYTTNKAFALSGLFLLILSSFSTYLENSGKSWLRMIHMNRGMLGFSSLVIINIHVLISLIIIRPSYFEKFFSPDGKMYLTGELSLLTGGVGLIMLWLTNRYFSFNGPSRNTDPVRKYFRQIISLSIVMTALHVAVMGYESWTEISDWHGHLPPITLISFLLTVLWLPGYYFLKSPKALS